MTKDEFQAWLAVHQSCFPGMATWLKTHHDLAKGILDEWQWQLRNITQGDAEQASRAIFADDNLRPRAYEHHPVAVAKLAGTMRHSRNSNSNQYSPRKQEIKCDICQDDGRLTVWHGVSVKACRPDTIRERENWTEETRPPRLLGEPFTVATVAVACSCDAGDPRAEGKVKMRRFDQERMLPAIAKDKAAQAELRTWVAERCSALSGPVPWTPPNFDDRDYTVTDDDFGPYTKART